MAALFLYYNKLRALPPRQALQRAIALGFEIWQAADYVMPAALADPEVRGKALREAGLVLKAEILGRSTISRLSAEAARPHPELIEVDPTALAQGIAGRILEGARRG